MAIVSLPGLIDVHTHLRDPSETHKEDFYTGTFAALAGGFTTILDMPNNKVPITSKKLLQEKIKLAKEKIVCDVGFYFGSLGDNLEEFQTIQHSVFGLKLYLNTTTGRFLIPIDTFERIGNAWFKEKPILLHAEGEILDHVIRIIKKTRNKTHICHVSSAFDVMRIIQAKEAGLPLTCGVTPHHLFLYEGDIKTLGPFGIMKPSLKTKKDQEFLWNHIHAIDVVESDHAPHTIEEKQSGRKYFGVPGLETTLPLLLQAEHEGKIQRKQIIDLCFVNPAKIFHIPTDVLTKIEIDTIPYKIDNTTLKTKCAWSPFQGFKVRGKVRKVFIRGKKVYEDGRILVKPGSGRTIRASSQ